MGLDAAVTLFPADPGHRLVGRHLAAFLDRLAERVVALGSGAHARVRAGRFDAEVDCLRDLFDTLDAAREQARGREDLEVRLWGRAQDGFAKFVGRATVEVKFFAFVEPRLILDAQLCSTCERPYDFNGFTKTYEPPCSWRRCSELDPHSRELEACWWLRFFGEGADGIGERFEEENRRLEGSAFFEALQGVARVPLQEWHTWS